MLTFRTAETESFHRVGNAPRVDGNTGSNVARRAGRCPRGETRMASLLDE